MWQFVCHVLTTVSASKLIQQSVLLLACCLRPLQPANAEDYSFPALGLVCLCLFFNSNKNVLLDI